MKNDSITDFVKLCRRINGKFLLRIVYIRKIHVMFHRVALAISR